MSRLCSSLETELLPLVEKVRFGAAEVDNLRAAISVFLHLAAFLAVVRVRDPSSTADHAAALIAPVVALIANTHERMWPNVAVANRALSVALLAEAPYCNAWLLAAHNQIWMMLGSHPEADVRRRSKRRSASEGEQWPAAASKGRAAVEPTRAERCCEPRAAEG